MRKDSLIFIGHISESIEKIEKFIKDISKTDFEKDEMRQGAIIREIEIIGEAVRNLPKDFINKYSSIPWKQIIGMRDKLIHHYFGVDFNLIWKVIKEDIPILKKEINEILKREKA